MLPLKFLAILLNVPLVLFATVIFGANAATYLNKTRVVMSQHDEEVTFSVINTDDKPALIQLWIDDDKLHTRPEEIKSSFVIIPPIFKLGSKETRTVLVKRIGDYVESKQKVESLYWLNVLEVPPIVTPFEKRNEIQMAIRTRVKLFYRPGSNGEHKIDESIEKLKYEITDCQSNKCLKLYNNSPIHLTFLKVKTNDSNIYDKLPNDGLINPFSTMEIQLKKGVKVNEFDIYWIDDFGVINITKNDVVDVQP
ncbi:TPA: molecular chaperone [Enterobacter hormaechei]